MSTYAIYNFDPKSPFAKIVAWTLSSFDQIQPLANPSKKELIKIGVKEARMKTYYLWADPADFKPIRKEVAKKRLDYTGKFLVLFVGRLIPIKAPQNIMKVAMQLPKINFAFIGDGPLAAELKRASYGFDNIKFVGRVERKVLKQYFNAADIFVLPSIYEEAFGKVAIEALFSGTPVIGSKRGAIPDVINPEVGRVIEPTIGNFRKEIEYFHEHPKQLVAITSNCRKYAMQRFTEKNARVIEKGYHDEKS